jgi:hypothetical protein
VAINFKIIFVKIWVMLKLVASFTAALFVVATASSQQVINLDENMPYTLNGLDYGYYITNESNREVKGEDYFRYEVNLFVTNKNGCLKLIPFKTGWTGNTSGSEDGVLLAEFNCTNATGKRLTAKKGSVNAKPWYNNVRVPDESTKDKYKTVNAQIGYAIHNGQTLTNRIIVIVPKGDRPKVNCRTVYLPEIQ